jgi:hypothetical protein
MSWSCYISVLLELLHIIQQANVGVAHEQSHLQRCSEIDFKTRGLLGRDNFHTLHEFETKNSHAICKSHQDIIKQRNVKKKIEIGVQKLNGHLKFGPGRIQILGPNFIEFLTNSMEIGRITKSGSDRILPFLEPWDRFADS